MGNICFLFCRTVRCEKCGVPYNYYTCEEHRNRPSCRGSSYDVINNYHMINDYPGIDRNSPRYKNDYHSFR